MAIKRKKLMTVLIVVAVIALGGGAAYVAWTLSKTDDVTPGDSSAASQEVWNAEIVTTSEERIALAAKWEKWEDDEEFTFAKAKGYAVGEGARFKNDQKIMTVGAETLYGADLNYYMVLFNFDKYKSTDALTDGDVDPVIDKMISDSLILQKAAELNLVELSGTFYNSINIE